MSGAVMNERVGAEGKFLLQTWIDLTRGLLQEMRIEWLTSWSAWSSVRCALHSPGDFITLLAESGRTRNGNCDDCKHGIPP